jgi:hypothetical protein
MYHYYKHAEVCYAYLSDVPSQWPMREQGGFATSKWHKRGWTLQELIAPSHMVFFSLDWHRIGTKQGLSAIISSVTKIDQKFLLDSSLLREASMAKRLSWASSRKTTRQEDIAYCLLGICDINMPLHYGEGNKAFTRLQEEIMKESTDQSLFAWQCSSTRLDDSKAKGVSILASHPADFADSYGIIPIGAKETYAMTNKGLRISRPIVEGHSYHTAILSCRSENDFHRLIGIRLESGGEPGVYTRSRVGIDAVNESQRSKAEVKSILLLKGERKQAQLDVYAWIRTVPPARYGFGIDDTIAPTSVPLGAWSTSTRTAMLSQPGQFFSVVFKRNMYPAVVIAFRPSLTFYSTVGFPQNNLTLDPPQVDISFVTNGVDPTLTLPDEIQSIYSKASASFEPELMITATASWQKVMDNDVLVLDIKAQDTFRKEMLYMVRQTFEDWQQTIMEVYHVRSAQICTCFMSFMSFPFGKIVQVAILIYFFLFVVSQYFESHRT